MVAACSGLGLEILEVVAAVVFLLDVESCPGGGDSLIVAVAVAVALSLMGLARDRRSLRNLRAGCYNLGPRTRAGRG